MQVIELIDKYYSEENELKRVFLSHALSVKEKALDIACAHPELGVDTEFLSEAAMLHDIGVFMTSAPDIYCFGSAPYICHGYLGADLLRGEGYPRHALVCERHTGTGLSLREIVEQRLPIPLREMVPLSMEEQVICFADKFFSKTRPGEEKSLECVRRNIAGYGGQGPARFDEWCRLFQV